MDADGHGVGPGVEGEITVSGAGPGRSYFKEAEATTQTWRHGWLHSGDLGRVDEDGFLWITGRTKDLIIRGGHNVAPGEVENALYAHPDVVEAAVAASPTTCWARMWERGSCCAGDRGRPRTTCGAFVATRLADYKVPRRLSIVTGLPRNAAGKVAKLELAAEAGRAAGRRGTETGG